MAALSGFMLTSNMTQGGHKTKRPLHMYVHLCASGYVQVSACPPNGSCPFCTLSPTKETFPLCNRRHFSVRPFTQQANCGNYRGCSLRKNIIRVLIYKVLNIRLVYLNYFGLMGLFPGVLTQSI